MADGAALSDLLDRASKVFSLAGTLGHAFHREFEERSTDTPHHSIEGFRKVWHCEPPIGWKTGAVQKARNVADKDNFPDSLALNRRESGTPDTIRTCKLRFRRTFPNIPKSQPPQEIGHPEGEALRQTLPDDCERKPSADALPTCWIGFDQLV